MRIIKDKTAKEYACRYCGSVLEVNDMDINHMQRDLKGNLVRKDYFYCPCCGKENIIKSEVL